MFQRISIVMVFVLLFSVFGAGASGQDRNRDLFGSAPTWPDATPGLMPIENDDDELSDDDEFSDEVAGSYYLEGSLTLLPDGPVLPFFGLQTYHADGTLVTTDVGSFVDPAAPQSPGHGSWVRTGEMQVTNTGWIFLFGTFGGLCDNTPPNPPNPFCLIAVPVGPVDFEYGFATGYTTFETKIWLAGTNPAVDDPLVPVPTAAGEATLTRIDVPMP